MTRSFALKAAVAGLALALGGTAAATQLTAQGAITQAATKKKAAPSACAGLTETSCKGNNACTWYRETTTKKGTKRKAHCQKKPSKKAA